MFCNQSCNSICVRNPKFSAHNPNRNPNLYNTTTAAAIQPSKPSRYLERPQIRSDLHPREQSFPPSSPRIHAWPPSPSLLPLPLFYLRHAPFEEPCLDALRVKNTPPALPLPRKKDCRSARLCSDQRLGFSRHAMPCRAWPCLPACPGSISYRIKPPPSPPLPRYDTIVPRRREMGGARPHTGTSKNRNLSSRPAARPTALWGACHRPILFFFFLSPSSFSFWRPKRGR
ncbi:hypothetical protein BS50DRAFT_70972 [Corynespora cassiicola Philippines]|uniref:Uncharacterized protein n=1 Tax=Corynespora cassiicola Philippines TaxID=1448308 RepID=A0A2T2NH26_CORCC|nr:hypothetical protein BS50DRAFT_70972 [Corynespora cassiicola Philippines]